jgi:hypothetical protein
MKKCASDCALARVCCENRQCRLHIEYEEDFNCTLVALDKHGPMTLEEIGRRHQISTVRAKQILDATLIKLKKTLVKENTI